MITYKELLKKPEYRIALGEIQSQKKFSPEQMENRVNELLSQDKFKGCFERDQKGQIKTSGSLWTLMLDI